MQETEEIQFGSLGQEHPHEQEMATCSRILAWNIPGTGEPGVPQFPGSQSQIELSIEQQLLNQASLVIDSPLTLKSLSLRPWPLCSCDGRLAWAESRAKGRAGICACLVPVGHTLTLSCRALGSGNPLLSLTELKWEPLLPLLPHTLQHTPWEENRRRSFTVFSHRKRVLRC